MFRGREIVERTTHTYDDHGRLVSSRTVRDPEWLATDRWLALAFEMYEASLCPGCRQQRDDAWHPDAEGWWEARQHECHACTAQKGEKVRFATVINTRPEDRPLRPIPA